MQEEYANYLRLQCQMMKRSGASRVPIITSQASEIPPPVRGPLISLSPYVKTLLWNNSNVHNAAFCSYTHCSCGSAVRRGLEHCTHEVRNIVLIMSLKKHIAETKLYIPMCMSACRYLRTAKESDSVAANKHLAKWKNSVSVNGKGPERRDGMESDLLRGQAFGIRRQEASLLCGRIVGHFLHS